MVEDGLELPAISSAAERITTTNPPTMAASGRLRGATVRVIGIFVQHCGLSRDVLGSIDVGFSGSSWRRPFTHRTQTGRRGRPP